MGDYRQRPFRVYVEAPVTQLAIAIPAPPEENVAGLRMLLDSVSSCKLREQVLFTSTGTPKDSDRLGEHALFDEFEARFVLLDRLGSPVTFSKMLSPVQCIGVGSHVVVNNTACERGIIIRVGVDIPSGPGVWYTVQRACEADMKCQRHQLTELSPTISQVFDLLGVPPSSQGRRSALCVPGSRPRDYSHEKASASEGDADSAGGVCIEEVFDAYSASSGTGGTGSAAMEEEEEIAEDSGDDEGGVRSTVAVPRGPACWSPQQVDGSAAALEERSISEHSTSLTPSLTPSPTASPGGLENASARAGSPRGPTEVPVRRRLWDADDAVAAGDVHSRDGGSAGTLRGDAGSSEGTSTTADGSARDAPAAGTAREASKHNTQKPKETDQVAPSSDDMPQVGDSSRAAPSRHNDTTVPRGVLCSSCQSSAPLQTREAACQTSPAASAIDTVPDFTSAPPPVKEEAESIRSSGPHGAVHLEERAAAVARSEDTLRLDLARLEDLRRELAASEEAVRAREEAARAREEAVQAQEDAEARQRERGECEELHSNTGDREGRASTDLYASLELREAALSAREHAECEERVDVLTEDESKTTSHAARETPAGGNLAGGEDHMRVREQSLLRREAALAEALADLDLRAASVAAREDALRTAQAVDGDEGEAATEPHSADLRALGVALAARERAVASREVEVSELLVAAQASSGGGAELGRLAQEVSRSMELHEAVVEATNRHLALDAREEALERAQLEIQQRGEALEAAEVIMKKKQEDLEEAAREHEVEVLSLREQRNNIENVRSERALLDQRVVEVQRLQENLRRREEDNDHREAEINRRTNAIKHKEGEIRRREDSAEKLREAERREEKLREAEREEKLREAEEKLREAESREESARGSVEGAPSACVGDNEFPAGTTVKNVNVKDENVVNVKDENVVIVKDEMKDENAVKDEMKDENVVNVKVEMKDESVVHVKDEMKDENVGNVKDKNVKNVKDENVVKVNTVTDGSGVRGGADGNRVNDAEGSSEDAVHVARLADLARLQAAVNAQAVAVTQREEGVKTREEAIAHGEAGLARLAGALDVRLRALEQREERCRAREHALPNTEAALAERVAEVGEMQRVAGERESRMARRETAVGEREAAAVLRERTLAQREAAASDLHGQEERVLALELTVSERENVADEKEGTLAMKELELDQRELALDRREEALVNKETMATERLGSSSKPPRPRSSHRSPEELRDREAVLRDVEERLHMREDRVAHLEAVLNKKLTSPQRDSSSNIYNAPAAVGTSAYMEPPPFSLDDGGVLLAEQLASPGESTGPSPEVDPEKKERDERKALALKRVAELERAEREEAEARALSQKESSLTTRQTAQRMLESERRREAEADAAAAAVKRRLAEESTFGGRGKGSIAERSLGRIMRTLSSRTLNRPSSDAMGRVISVDQSFDNATVSITEGTKVVFTYRDVHGEADVLRGTPERLSRHLAGPGAGPRKDFMDTFLLLFYYFMSPEKLMQTLKATFNEPRSPVQGVVRQRVVAATEAWMEGYWADIIRADLEEELEGFFLEIGGVPEFAGALMRLREVTDAAKAKHAQSEVPRTILPCASPAVLQMREKTVAESLVMLDWILLTRIEPRELLAKTVPSVLRLPKGGKHPTTNVDIFVQRFNRVTQWVASEVVSTLNLRLRASVIEKFIKIGATMRALNDFSGTIAVFVGLTCPAVARLKRTWEVVSQKPQVKAEFNRLSALAKPTGNYSVYREEVKASLQQGGAAIIPFLAVITRDVTFFHDGNPTLDESGLVNFVKLKRIAKQILAVRDAQSTPPPSLRIAEAVLRAFETDNLKILTEDEQRRYSKQIDSHGRS